MNRLFFAGFGFGVWALATLVFRLAGHLFFLDDNVAVLALIWLGTVIGLIGLSLFVFRWRGLTNPQRFEAAALMVLPGMILDGFVTEIFTTVFPNMPATSDSSFAAWLLIAYASVLIAAFLPIMQTD